jgi:hypothetical protein
MSASHPRVSREKEEEEMQKPFTRCDNQSGISDADQRGDDRDDSMLDECEACRGSGELPCDEDTCCCEGGHPCPCSL